MAEVAHIYVAAGTGEPCRDVPQADARAGAGLVGDRYGSGTGFWRDLRVSRDLTLIEAEVVEELALSSGSDLEPGALRRNLTTRGVRLNELVGRMFWVGDVLCGGTELCEPCHHLEQVTGRVLLRALVHRGGLRARILSDGMIRIGDGVEAVEMLDGVASSSSATAPCCWGDGCRPTGSGPGRVRAVSRSRASRRSTAPSGS